jgi:3-hexulose-6-phosphate synthase
MQLQIALDRMSLTRALEITTAVAPHVDWIEVGTSLVKRYGMDAVSQVVEAAGGKPVLADLKTVDDAAYEFGLSFDAGASSATVLALADDVTIDTAVRVAAERGLEAVVDLMVVPLTRRAVLAARLPHAVVLAGHVGKDAQAAGSDPAALLGEWARGRQTAVAGGLGAADVGALAAIEDLRAIIGSAVTGRPDPVEATLEILAAAGRTVTR